jgi:hypothetical protein
MGTLVRAQEREFIHFYKNNLLFKITINPLVLFSTCPNKLDDVHYF